MLDSWAGSNAGTAACFRNSRPTLGDAATSYCYRNIHPANSDTGTTYGDFRPADRDRQPIIDDCRTERTLSPL